MSETIYSNHAVVAETETEVVLDFHLRTGGKPAHQVRVILAPVVAAKLGLLLRPETVAEPVADQPTLEPQKAKAKRARRPTAKADAKQVSEG